MDNNVANHFAELVKWLLSPEVLSQIGVYTGIGASIVGFCSRWSKTLWDKLEQKQNDELKSLRDSVESLSVSFELSRKDTEKELLRIQIITGIQSGRLSKTELLMLYDTYVSKGYNSYITRVVNDYLDELD